MEMTKKSIAKFFHPEMLWFVIPFLSAIVPLEITNQPPVFMSQTATVVDYNDIKYDMNFVHSASEGGLMEIKLGQLAQNNAGSDDVKKFGKVMIEDHTKTNKELSAFAHGKEIILAGTLNKKLQKKYAQLEKKTGADFDKTYISYMISDHKEDIAAFEKEVEIGKDPEIKNWAANKIPVLKHHLYLANKAFASLKTK
jgi:putative membrane protein